MFTGFVAIFIFPTVKDGILNLIQGYFVPSSITCVNSMEVSYIPIAKARGFTTHWING